MARNLYSRTKKLTKEALIEILTFYKNCSVKERKSISYSGMLLFRPNHL